MEIRNAPLIEVFDEWVLNIDMNKLQKEVFKQLAWQHSPLTGNEVAFIRKYLEMTKTGFGKLFGVAHSAVSKWEEKDDEFIKISISTDRLIRLHMIEHLNVKDAEFRQCYRNFHTMSLKNKETISPDPVLIEM